MKLACLLQIVLGKCVAREAPVDQELAQELYACAKEADPFKTVLGTTLCADDFYEGNRKKFKFKCNNNVLLRKQVRCTNN